MHSVAVSFQVPADAARNHSRLMERCRRPRTINLSWAMQYVGWQPRQPNSIQCAVVLSLHRSEDKQAATHRCKKTSCEMCYKTLSQLDENDTLGLDLSAGTQAGQILHETLKLGENLDAYPFLVRLSACNSSRSSGMLSSSRW